VKLGCTRCITLHYRAVVAVETTWAELERLGLGLTSAGQGSGVAPAMWLVTSREESQLLHPIALFSQRIVLPGLPAGGRLVSCHVPNEENNGTPPSMGVRLDNLLIPW
jgi:hypothetical protein